MWDKIISFFYTIWSYWEKLDEKTKQAIIEAIIEYFEPVFRKQYKDSRQSEAK